MSGKRYRIKTLQDVADRLADPGTRENFERDFLEWMRVVKENSARMHAVKGKAEAIVGRKAVLRQRCNLTWIDDGKHDINVNVQVNASGVPLAAFEP